VTFIHFLTDCFHRLGAVHLLNDVKSPYVASMALLDRDGQLYVHCLDENEDSPEFTLFSSIQRPVDVSQNHLEVR